MSPSFDARYGVGLLLVPLLTAVAGCAFADRAKMEATFPEAPDPETQATQRALQDDMRQFLEYLEDEVATTADGIEAANTDADVQKAALLWKIRVIGRANDAMVTKDALALLVDCWSFCVRQVEYLQHGEGRALFADRQPAAVATAVRLRNRIEATARTHIPEAELPDFIRRIEAHARANPIRGLFEWDTPEAFSEGEGGQTLLQRFVSSPIRSLTRAGKDALDPTSRLADSVDRFTELMEGYPAQLRWQAQLLWMQLEDSPSIRTTMASLDDVSKSSVRLAAVAEELPQRVRQEVQVALDDVIAQQPELRKTLEEARETVDASNAALERAETVSASIERSLTEVSRAGEVWQTTAEAVTDTLQQIQRLREPRGTGEADDSAPTRQTAEGAAAAGESQPPFDINDYTRTAEALTRSSEELRALLAEVRAFVEGEALGGDLSRFDALTASALGQTRTEARAVIDHLSWRAVQISGLVFVLALFYRLVASRWIARGGA